MNEGAERVMGWVDGRRGERSGRCSAAGGWGGGGVIEIRQMAGETYRHEGQKQEVQEALRRGGEKVTGRQGRCR